jgi:alpha-L-arabinofuranosidase
MKHSISLSLLSICLIFFSCEPRNESTIRLQVTSIQPAAPISPFIYGHFYEHIYHSANGGLWGDLVWNRSFEEFLQKPDWKIGDGIISQNETINDVKLIFGDSTWTDYEFTLEGSKKEGDEGFLILFRATGEDNFYWLNLGGWGNTSHCIEKETNNSRTVITTTISGSISKNEWYPIKITVSGNNLKAYLNEKLLFDYTDTIQPRLSGSVGIGSWGTAVSYRNLKVTDPSGKVLFSGLPDVSDNLVFPRHWTPSDAAKFALSQTGALNGSNSIVGSPSGKAISIKQENFAVKMGDRISGSIWLKGSPGVKVAVQLKANGAIRSESVIDKIAEKWKEYPISFDPQTETGKMQLEVVLSGTGTANIDQLSLMKESSLANDGFRTDLFDAVAAIKPTIIRWPGGCFAELYRWKDGIGPQHKRIAFPVSMWDDKDVNSLGTDEFIVLSRKLNSEPLIVINSGFHEGAGTPEAWAPWIREACEWIEYCNGPATSTWGAVRAANGHPEPYAVKYWEIDNELWRSKVPDPNKYSEAVKLFARAMRETDPTITILAHGGNGADMEWNQVVLDKCATDFDLLSIHHYSEPDHYFSAALEQDSLYKKLKKSIAASANPSIKIYVSEWNAQSTDWRTGMYAGNLLNIFELNSDIVTIAGPALFLRHISASAWDNAFINFDQSGWFPAPNYVVMKLWNDHFAPDRLELIGAPDSIIAVASYSDTDNRMVIKMVNNCKADKNLVIELPDNYSPSIAEGFLVRGNSLSDRNTMEHPDKIKPENHPTIIKKGKLSTRIPASSCLLVELK